MIGVMLATSREAEPLLARAGVLNSRDQDLPLIYDLRPARQMVICVCGMGPTKARAGLDVLLNAYDVTSVVNVGVAGAVVEGKEVGGIFRISKACLWPETKTMYACRLDRWLDLPSAVLATVEQPVFDPVWRGDIARHADVVDMEGAVIAQGCRAKGMPLYAIKGVTDLAGKNDRERLLANLDRISMVLAERVWQELVP